jgi:hypothetical protein
MAKARHWTLAVLPDVLRPLAMSAGAGRGPTGISPKPRSVSPAAAATATATATEDSKASAKARLGCTCHLAELGRAGPNGGSMEMQYQWKCNTAVWDTRG